MHTIKYMYTKQITKLYTNNYILSPTDCNVRDDIIW